MRSIREYKGSGGKWIVYLKFRGKQFSQVVQTKREGQAWKVEKRKELLNQLNKQNFLMFSKIAETYLEDCQSRYRANTVAYKYKYFSDFTEFCNGDITIENIKLDICRTFITDIQKRKGNKTANRYLREFKACWNWHKRILKDNLWTDIKPYPEDKPVKYVPPDEDLKIIIDRASQWEKDFINSIIKTGARLSELLNLKWDEVLFDEKYLILWTRKRHNGEKQSRSIPIGDDLKTILNRRKESAGNNDYVFVNPRTNKKYEKNHTAIKHMLRRLCEKGGVKHFRFHSLRHYTSRTLMKSCQANLSDIQNFLGHQRASTTDLYLRDINPNINHLAKILDEKDVING